ncbi:MAG: hypothetical protein J7M26_01690 [Armatimonadetes bacterium]|nr:hypothetical protein [Armatimonadota bacterium]
MPLDLSNREWPRRDPELRGKPETGRLVASARKTFVSEGAVYVKAIDFNGLMRPIPRNSSAITSLALRGEVVYGATSGEESWLFQYALTSFRETALPLGPIPDCQSVRNSLAPAPDGSLYGAGKRADGTSALFRVTGLHLPGDIIQEWGIVQPNFETVGEPVPGEEVICLRADRKGARLYGLTAPSGNFFHFDLASREVHVVGRVDPIKFFSPVLVQGPDGEWYSFGTTGRMMRYDAAADSLEDTGVYVPCFPGRGPYARIAAAAVDAVQQRLYVGDTEGLLSVIDLPSGSVTTLGKPVPIGGIDHLVRLADGRVYGVAGSREGMAHLFVHEPATGALRDLGVLCATTEKPWYGYRFGAMVATDEGRIILGEDDHLGCLFSYFPPALPPPRPVEAAG